MPCASCGCWVARPRWQEHSFVDASGAVIADACCRYTVCTQCTIQHNAQLLSQLSQLISDEDAACIDEQLRDLIRQVAGLAGLTSTLQRPGGGREGGNGNGTWMVRRRRRAFRFMQYLQYLSLRTCMWKRVSTLRKPDASIIVQGRPCPLYAVLWLWRYATLPDWAFWLLGQGLG